MIDLVVLWTDGLIFLLVVLAAVFAFYARRKEHLRAPWRVVSRSKVGMGALVVLSVYVLIGLLDSIHYRPQPDANGETESAEVLSVFDYLCHPLRSRQEKTYSAPLAVHQYTKENIELPDGRHRAGLSAPRVRWRASAEPGAGLADRYRVPCRVRDCSRDSWSGCC